MADRVPSLSLFVDLYELTMAQVYWRKGMAAPATFSLYFRSYPQDRAYFVLAGVQDVLEYLEGFHYTDDDLELLRSLERFSRDFIKYLRGVRFTGSVRAMSEGSIFFADEPVMEVTAPVIEAQIVETFLINQINLQSVLATKSSRVVHSARGRAVVDFAARRTHGIDAASKLARACYLAGFAGTSNVLAGVQYAIPTFGTMAHSFVQCFHDEVDAFRAYAESFPDTSTFLVDTYDTVEGVRKAIVVAEDMRRRGHALTAIRLDSGDLLALSVKARALLDEAGLEGVQVFASGGLDEFELDVLLRAGAPIDGFGVGTKVGVSADAPWTDGAYKLVEYDGRPTLKLSAKKRTAPGPKQVFRFRDEKGAYERDVIGLAGERPPDNGAEALLSKVMAGGKRLGQPPTLKKLRERFEREFACLPDRHKALRSPAMYPVNASEKLRKLEQAVSQEVRDHELGG